MGEEATIAGLCYSSFIGNFSILPTFIQIIMASGFTGVREKDHTIDGPARGNPEKTNADYVHSKSRFWG